MEHRWGERSKLNIPVQLECGSRGVVLGVMRDASASGAFVCTAVQLPLLTIVRVEFGDLSARPDRSGAYAHVVRRATDGFGLEWTELAPDTILQLLHAPPVTSAIQPAFVDAAAPSVQTAIGVAPLPTTPSRKLEETAAG